jgi:hypothetical protein
MKNVHNAATDALMELGLAEIMTDLTEDEPNHRDQYLVTFRYRENPEQYVMFLVKRAGNHMDVEERAHHGISSGMRMILFEELAISIDPDYFDDED